MKKEWESSYACFSNNPILNIDPLGNDAKPIDLKDNAKSAKSTFDHMTTEHLENTSTHTDKRGNVIAVYNDGDLGVYKHNGDEEQTRKELANKYSATNTSGGGKWMGTTQHWDEFVTPEDGVARGVIMYEQSWMTTLNNLHKESMKYDLKEIGEKSRNNGDLDLKSKFKYAPYGVMTGKLLNGQYASARSAGNYLAGWNGATGTYLTLHLTKFEYMNLAGSLQTHQYQGSDTYYDINFKDRTYGPAPYYGEIPYSGRWISQGFDKGSQELLDLWNK
ncbi:MAG: hypothetical protein NT150_00965 [Bacteroidetes bacterium]|nr:hypothetical protein [Bacteroidota bacterium]